MCEEGYRKFIEFGVFVMFANNRDVILIPVCILIIIIGSIPVTALDAPIDTELVYSSYIGGSEDDTGSALAPDGSGGIWVAGWINQSTQGGGHLDAFVSHFSSTGMLLSSTYLGGSEYDIGNALAPDGSGGVWVAGHTDSTDFPVTDDAYQRNHKGSGDAFVSHFSSTGVLLFSTYLGGSYSEDGWDLAFDGSGGVWVVGETCSNDFPVTDDAYQNSKAGGTGDAFVSHFSSQARYFPPLTLGEAIGIKDMPSLPMIPAGSGSEGGLSLLISRF